MATYNTAFGSLPGYNEMLGTTNTTGGGQQQMYDPQRRQRRQQQPGQSQTFAQMQQQGVARPAPPPPQGFGGYRQQQQPPMLRQLQQQFQPMAGGGQQVTERYAQAPQPEQPQQAMAMEGPELSSQAQSQDQALRQQMQQQMQGFRPPSYGGEFGPSIQAQPSAATPMQMYQGLLGQLQEQLGQTFAQPSGFSTEQFQQIRGAQVANLQAEYGAQQQALNEELARRGLSASSIGGGRMGDLAGQQARALASLDAQLLQQQAEMGQRGREAALGTLAQATGQLGQQVLGQQEVGLRASEIQQRGEQFGLQLNEQQAARLQQFGISTQELGLRAQQIQNEAALQGRQLSITEAQNQAQNQLEAQRITNQASQFGLQLSEQQAARAQQAGFTAQELGLRTQQLQQEADLEGRRLSVQEAQNKAVNQLERDRLIQQGQQFGLQLGETQAARLQQYGLSTQELGLQAQRLQQDAALQGRQLSITEAQNLAQNQLEQQRVTNQAAQFGLQLNEQQAQRLQQGGFTAQELALESQRVANQALQFGQQLSAQERQNQAINALESRKLNEDANFRSQQLGLNRDELEARKEQIRGDLALRGIEIDDQRAYREAEIEARTQQIQNEFLRSGQQIDVDKARIQAQKDISDADNTAQMNRLEAQITAQASESALERRLRGALGMAETTGFVFDPATGRIVQQDGQNVMTVQGRSALAQQRLAENQFLMQLVSALGNVDLGKSIKDLIDSREPIDKNQTYDPRLGGGVDGKEGGDTGQTDPVKGRRPIASESNPFFMDSLASVLDQPTARATSATPSSSTLQALAAALGISPAALQSTLSPRSTTQSAQSALSGLFGSPSSSTATAPTSSVVQQAMRQNPSLQALNARLAALPANQRSRYIPVDRLPPQFLQGQAVPEEAQPGTVFNNYSVGPTGTTYGNTFMGYDGVGFIPLTRQVESTPGGGRVYRYYTATGQNWA